MIRPLQNRNKPHQIEEDKKYSAFVRSDTKNLNRFVLYIFTPFMFPRIRNFDLFYSIAQLANNSYIHSILIDTMLIDVLN